MARQEKRHQLFQRRLMAEGEETAQRVDGHEQLMLSAVDGVFQRASLVMRPMA